METITKKNFFYPAAMKWMWNYCTPLGKYSDTQGDYDLGIHMDSHGQICEATVCGNQAGNYWSGDFRYIGSNPVSHARKLEVLTRAIKAGIISQMPMCYAL